MPTGFVLGEEAKARALLDSLESDVRAGVVPDSHPGSLTLRRYATRWLKRNRATKASRKDEEGRLQHHVLGRPIGAMKLEEIRPRHLKELVTET